MRLNGHLCHFHTPLSLGARLGGGDFVERPARARRDVERVGHARAPAARAGPGDHGAVVGAQLQRRRHQRRCRPRRRGDAAPCGSPGWRRRRRRRPARSARRICARNMRKPARSRSSTTSTTACWNEAHRSATSWSDSGAIFSASSRSAVFRPESEKSASLRPCIGRGSAKRVASPRSGFLLDLRAARIAEAEQLGGLVEGLADGVVHGGAEPHVIADAAHGDDLGVAAGGEEQAIRKRRVVGQPRGQRMRFQMIDRDQRLVLHQRDGLGGGQADDDAADQPGAGGGGDAVEVVKAACRPRSWPGR